MSVINERETGKTTALRVTMLLLPLPLVPSLLHLLTARTKTDWRLLARRFSPTPPLLTSATAAPQAGCTPEGYAVFPPASIAFIGAWLAYGCWLLAFLS